MPKYKEIRQEKGLQARQVAEQAGIDPTLYSKIENYHVLPIPAEFSRLLDVLECFPIDVYSPNEVTLIPSAGGAETVGGSRVDCEPTEYKMTVRLGNECRAILTKPVLQKCGYKSISDWVNACVQRLKSQYENVLKAENRKPHQSKQTNGAAEARHTTDNSPTTIIVTNQNKNVKEAYHNERLL